MSDFKWREPGNLVDDDLALVLVRQTPAEPSKGYVPAYWFEMRRTGTEERMGNIELRDLLKQLRATLVIEILGRDHHFWLPQPVEQLLEFLEGRRTGFDGCRSHCLVPH